MSDTDVLIDENQLDLFAESPAVLAAAVKAERVGMVGADHAETAHAAARSVAPKTGTQRWKALEALADTPSGLTAFEAADLLHHRRPHVIGTRLIELREDGLVERNGATRPTDTGHQAEVYVITALGRQVLEAGAGE